MAEHDVETRPLTGLAVTDATAARAGSIAGMLLADLGADVVRIDAADGTNRRPHQSQLPDAVCWDRGKREQRFDRLDPEGDAALAQQLDRSAVLLLDLPPARLEESPLGPSRVGASRPGLVTVWTPPSGRHGSQYRDLGADPLLQAA